MFLDIALINNINHHSPAPFQSQAHSLEKHGRRPGQRFPALDPPEIREARLPLPHLQRHVPPHHPTPPGRGGQPLHDPAGGDTAALQLPPPIQRPRRRVVHVSHGGAGHHLLHEPPQEGEFR